MKPLRSGGRAMAGITGLPTSKKLQDSNQDLRDSQTQQYVTVQPMGSNRNAMDTIAIGYYNVQDGATVLTGSDNNTVVMTSHGAKVGDIFRITTSANAINEFEVSIKEIIDANSFKLNCILSASLVNGDVASILRPVAQRMDSTGASLASVISPPIQILRDGVATTVHKDTIDGSDTIPIPVEIVSGSGTEINISAGDINIHTSHTGGTPDSMQIGDGTEILLINASGEALVNDAAVEALLTTIDTDTGAIAVSVDNIDDKLPSSLGSKTSAQSLSVVLASDQAALPVTSGLPTGASTEAKQDTQITGLNDINSELDSINSKYPSSLGQKAEAASFSVTLSTENEQDLAGIRTAVELLDNAISGSEMQVDLVSAAQLPSALGQQNMAGSMSVVVASNQSAVPMSATQLPSALGQTNKAGSISVTLASDQGSIVVAEGPQAAVTVKSAQVTVGTSAVRITTDGSAPSSTRQMLSFRPIPGGSAKFYWGPSGVTTSTGAEVYPGESIILENNINDYYIISDTAAQKCHVVEAE
jgi:hypothetical protein